MLSELSLLQTDQPRLSQPVLLGEVLQPSGHPRSRSGSLQQVGVALCRGLRGAEPGGMRRIPAVRGAGAASGPEPGLSAAALELPLAPARSIRERRLRGGTGRAREVPAALPAAATASRRDGSGACPCRDTFIYPNCINRMGYRKAQFNIFSLISTGVCVCNFISLSSQAFIYLFIHLFIYFYLYLTPIDSLFMLCCIFYLSSFRFTGTSNF